ncbi:folate-binding protein YgfZ [Actinomyces massiliensis]|uniref:Glycine cleavage T-protein n=1 Tax=Actinomyces massiliensis F0489 TaxID=1125718 RepID=J0X2Y2_9ACTO|nr:folate-binding protein YgfZ [Actinomyces massiliensis]EJF42986.1 glycine cleavage T-protein [Actinomyces massiliensis F0489]WLD72134.1 folate-binding protein YgfZ [Actinomyces massiliensis]
MRRSPLLDRAGAVPNAVGDPDELVPAHYGDPLREQRLLESAAAVTVLARDVVAVTGADRLSWLTTLSSQVLTDLTPGDGGVETLVLDAKGRIVHALAALDDAETLWLVTEAGRGPALVEFLERMRFMLRVEVSVRDDVAVVAALGEGLERLETAISASPAVCLGVWRDPWPGVVEGGTSYDVGLTRAHPGSNYRAGLALVAEDALGAVVDAFLAVAPERGLAGSSAWEALRVEAGRPRWAREADERAIPHELDWLRTAVHLTKGCYPGQETVARTLNLGKPPRRLAILQLDGLAGALPEPGAVVRLGERAAGVATSVVRHHDLGPMALALLRRGVPADAALAVEVAESTEGAENTESDGPAVLTRVDAAQEVLVSPEGRAQASPAERPGAGLRKSLLH